MIKTIVVLIFSMRTSLELSKLSRDWPWQAAAATAWDVRMVVNGVWLLTGSQEGGRGVEDNSEGCFPLNVEANRRLVFHVLHRQLDTLNWRGVIYICIIPHRCLVRKLCEE